MNRQTNVQADNSLIKSYKRRSHLRRGIALLSAFVLLFTMNSLKQSADTLERVPMCGYEYEHTHTDECFDADGRIVCGLHEHTDACYQQRPVHAAAVDDEVDEVELDLGGAQESAIEAEVPAADEGPAEYAFDMGGAAEALLSEALAGAGLELGYGDIARVGVLDEADLDKIAVADLGGDYALTALADFDRLELGVDTTSEDIHVLVLSNAKAFVPEAEAELPENGAEENAEEENAAEVETAETENTEEEQAGEVTEEVTEETIEETTEEVAEEITEEAIEETTEEQAEEATEETIKEVTEEGTEETTEEQAAEVTEEVTEETTEEVTEEGTEETTEEQAAEVTEEGTEETTEEVAEEITEEAIGETTEEQTEETTEEVTGEQTEEVTEEAAEEQTEEATEDQTEEATEETTEEQTEEITEEQTEEVTGETTEETAEEATEETTEETAEEVTEEVTEETTEEVAEEITEEAIEETTEEQAAEATEEATEEQTEETTEEQTEEATEETTEEKTEETTEEQTEEDTEEAVEEITEEAAEEQTEEAAEETAGETAGEPAFAAGSRVIEIEGGSLTLSWGEEAGIPEDVRIEVVEIERGTEAYDALYNQALEALASTRDTETTTQVMRFFDITLYNNEEKFEPSAPVAMELKLDEAADAASEDVDAIHWQEPGADAQLVEATADGDVVSFEAESFSVYGVSVNVAPQEETEPVTVSVDLSGVDLMEAAEVGQTVSLSVEGLLAATDAAVAVEGELSIDTVTLLEKAEVDSGDDLTVEDGRIVLPVDSMADAALSLQAKSYSTDNYVTTETTHIVSIELTGYEGRTDAAEGEGVQVVAVNPEANSLPGDATVTLDEAAGVPEGLVDPEAAEGAAAFDITITNNNGDEIADTGAMRVSVQPTELNVLSDLPEGTRPEDVRYTLYHFHDGDAPTAIPVEDIVVSEDGTVESFSFQTDGFSKFVLKYTVEFHNGEKEVVIFGGSKVLLSTLIDRLGLLRENGDSFTVDEVEKVEFENPELFTVEEVEQDDEFVLNADTDDAEDVIIATFHDFVITSLEPFDETNMVLTLTDGEQVIVRVTDAYMGGNSILSMTPAITVQAVSSDQSVTIGFQNDNNENYSISGNYYVYAGVQKNGKNYVNLTKIDGSSITLNNWSALKANGGSESLELSSGDVIKLYLVVGASGQKPDDSVDIIANNKWSYSQNSELQNDACCLSVGDKIGAKAIKEISAIQNGNTVTATVTMGNPPKYSASVEFYESDGVTPVTNPTVTGKYYFFAKINYNGDKFSLIDTPVDFSKRTPVTFDSFATDSGIVDPALSEYNGSSINVMLVTPSSSGNAPNIIQAKNSQDGCTQLPANGNWSDQNITLGAYKLTGSQQGANFLIKAVKMPAYKVTSVFKDSTDDPVTPALSKGYYLVVKTNDGKYYVETYDPSREYEITRFFSSSDITGDGTGNNPAAYSDSTVISEVYLVSKSDAATPSAAATLTDNSKKHSSGNLEIYTLAETTSATPKGTTLTFTKKDGADVYTSTVKFFNEEAEVIEAAGDIGMHVDQTSLSSQLKAPALSKNYYVVATLVDKTDKSKIAGWAINPVTLNGHAETSTVFTEFVPYETGDSTGGEDRIAYSSAEDFPYEVVTRLYRTDAAQANPTYDDLVTHPVSNATDSAEGGYEFVGNWNPDATHNEIHLKEASPKTYAVRVRFKNSDVSGRAAFGTDGYYVVNVIVTHADGNQSVQYDRLLINTADFATMQADDEGYLYKEFTFPYWRKMDSGYVVKQDSDSNPKFTGNERNIRVELVKSTDNSKYEYNNYDSKNVYAEGKSAGAYIVHYDTRWTNPQNTLSRFHEEEIPGSDMVKCYDVIDLILPNAESEYDYATILGPNYMFGIVADHLFQNNDLQTNFAVNHYTGHGDYVTPDLSNTSGTIVIGEFNRNTDVMTKNHVGYAVSMTSTDEEDMKAGTLHLGSNITGSLVVYADDDSGSRYETYGVSGGTPVADQRETVHVSLQNGADLQSQIVDPGIQYGVNMSRTLASKDATYTPEFRENKPYVDTTGFGEDATIYINADALLTVSGEQPDDVYGTLYALQNLTINKKPGQMLIFNFKETKNVKLSQFNVKYNGGNNFYTNTTTGKSDTNVKMEEISKHIVWNFASCTGRVELSEVGGICLQPNYGSETQISGTSGGWLVSNGYVYNNSAEWHNFFSEVPDTAEATLRVLKTVDDKVPVANEMFDFTLSEYKNNGWTELATQQNERSIVKFVVKDEKDTPVEDRKLTPGWHVYKIEERQQKPAGNTTGLSYDFDPAVCYYAAVYVTDFGATRVASAPRYFRTFNEESFNSAGDTGMALPAALSDELAIVTFKNEVKTVGLSIHKTVEGTDSSKLPFTFKVELWTDAGYAFNPSYIVDGVPGTGSISLEKNTTTNRYEGTLNLRNGQTATIIGLPENTKYVVTETDVNGVAINTTTGVAEGTGYTAQKVASEEKILPSGGAREDFVNIYHASGSATLHAHKVLKDGDTTVPLPENAFGFELYQLGNGTPIETAYNNNQGNVDFTALTFTEADMEGAMPNPFTGKRVKTIVYRVHEIDGKVSGVDYDQVINDTDKTVVVTLVDEGNGTIRATAYPADFTFRFNNEKGVEVVLEGSKTIVGRDMKGGEVYRFIAEETVESVTKTVATAIVTGARDGEETAFSFTPIKYTQPGKHTYTIREVVPATTDGKMTYDTRTYTATVTVTENAGKLSATVVYSASASFVNTSNETTSASVEKVWSDGSQEHTHDSVKVRLYKVYGVAVEAANIPTGNEPKAYNPGSADAVPVTGGTDIALTSANLPAGAEGITGSEVMLNRGNGWKHTWSKLPTMEKVSGTWKYVSYYPVEVWSTNTNIATTAYSRDAQTNKTTITNTISEPTSVSATKAWASAVPANTSVEVTLTATTADGDVTTEVVAAADRTKVITGNDTVEWSSLPRKYQGKDITYTVAETKVTIGGEVVWNGTGENLYLKNTVVNGSNTTFTNDYTAVNVNKRFLRGSVGIDNWVKDQDFGAVYFKLYRKNASGSWYTVDEHGQPADKKFTLNYGTGYVVHGNYTEGGEIKLADGTTIHYVYEFKYLPVGEYEARECSADGSKVFENKQSVDDSSYMYCYEDEVKLWVLKNIVINVTASKNWDDRGLAIAKHPDVTFMLQKKVGNGSWTDVRQLILSEVHTGAGYQYHAAGTEATDGTVIEKPFVDWGYLPQWDFSAWAPITYRVVEVNAATGIPGYTPGTGATMDGNNVVGAGSRNAIHDTFTNVVTGPMDLYVKKQWKKGNEVLDNNNLPVEIPAEVTFKVMRMEYTDVARTTLVENAKAEEVTGLSAAVTKLVKSNNYQQVIIHDLPRVKINVPKEGDAYLTYYGYYVVEQNAPAGFTVTYQADGSQEAQADASKAVVRTPDSNNGITMINTAEPTFLKVVKKWSVNSGDPQDDCTFAPESISFKLYRSDDTTKAIDKATMRPATDENADTTFVINKQDGKYELTVEGLWDVDANGKKYTYYLVEDDIPGFSANPKITAAGADGNPIDVHQSSRVEGGTTVTVVNFISTVSLPSTGGTGTTLLYAVGAGLLLLAAAAWIVKARKETFGAED